MTGQDHWVALEAGPYFWKADTIYKFLKSTYDTIKPAVKRIRKDELKALGIKSKRKIPVNTSAQVQTPEDKKLDNFVKQLSSESDKVFSSKKWVNIMGAKVYDILKCDEFNVDIMQIDKDEKKKQCIVQLLRLIRNKMEHILDYSDDVKRKLPMFFGGGADLQKLTLNERFVSYWITKFPKLVSFLRKELKCYYPPVHNFFNKNEFYLMPVDQPTVSNTNVHCVVEELSRALISHLEKGSILKRFQLNDGPGSLEFRAIHGLLNILDKSSSVGVQIRPGENLRFVVSHSLTQQKLKYVDTRLALRETLILIFANNIENDEVWRDCLESEYKIIVFGSEKEMDEKNILTSVENLKAKNGNMELSEYPIRGWELTISQRNDIFEKSQVQIQGNYVNIKDIFSGCMADKICNGFYGDFLSQLLRKEKPILF